VFCDEHLLDLYGDNTVARFDANPRMAEAWQRLAEGNPPQRVMRSAINERTDVLGDCGRCQR
jgi:hypothetical protein